MKELTITIIATVTFALFFIVTDVSAQCGPVDRADVPFNFVVNGREARAGKYLIEKTNCGTSTPHVVLRDADGRVLGVVYRSTAEFRLGSSASRIVFTDHEGTRFLSEIRGADGRYSFRVRPAKAGLRLARTSAPKTTIVPTKPN